MILGRELYRRCSTGYYAVMNHESRRRRCDAFSHSHLLKHISITKLTITTQRITSCRNARKYVTFTAE